MDCQRIDYKAVYRFVLSILIINTLVSGKCWFCHSVNHNEHSQSMLFRHVNFRAYLYEVYADWHSRTCWRFKTWNFLIDLCALLITLNCQVLKHDGNFLKWTRYFDLKVIRITLCQISALVFKDFWVIKVISTAIGQVIKIEFGFLDLMHILHHWCVFNIH